MSDAVMIAIVAAAPGIAASILSFLNNAIAKRTEARGIANTAHIESMEVHTNGMKDALVKLTGEAEYAKGLKVGQEQK